MAINDIYPVWSVDFPISRDETSPYDQLYRPYILTSGSFGCPDLFSTTFARAVQTDDELLRHMGHINDAQHCDPSSIRTSLNSVDDESCANKESNISKTSCQTTLELSLCQSLPETLEKSGVVESIKPHVKIADNEINTASITPSALSSLPSQSTRKPRRVQQKKDPALLQAWSSNTAGFHNLNQASIPSWAPALQRAPAPKPNRSPRAKSPYRKWARPTPGPSQSAALLTNKLAARRSRKTKKEWISQRERIGDCLRRMIEVRLAEITLLEAEVARLKTAISRCRGCIGRYWSSKEALGECTACWPNDTLSLEWVPTYVDESNFS